MNSARSAIIAIAVLQCQTCLADNNAYTNPLSMTCGVVREVYRDSGCCGMPDREVSSGLQADVPQAIVDFYDKILTDPGGYGQDMELISQTMDEDWNTRPNPLNLQEGTGPGPAGLQQIMSGWSYMFPGIYIQRMQTMVFGGGSMAVVLSKFGATMGELPPWGITEFPAFPGIPVETIQNKSFETLALDIQVLKNGKIWRTWHLEDWAAAQDQLVNGVPPPMLEHLPFEGGDTLTQVPQCIYDFYDEILSDPAASAQDTELLQSALSDDWETRPNPLNLVEGTGPYSPSGISGIMGLWGVMWPGIVIERKRMLLFGDKVVVLSKFNATLMGLPEGVPEYPAFPGIDPATITGKSFSSIAMDIQVVKDGKVYRTWHLEDWSSAQAQVVNDEPAPDFGFSSEYA